MTTRTSSINFSDTAVAFSHLSDRSLKRAYRMFSIMNKPWLVAAGSTITRFALKLRLPVKPLIRHTIFRQFCGGETIEECEGTIRELGGKNIGTILDYSVEGEDNERSFDATLRHLLSTIEAAAKSNDIPFAVFKVTGIARTALLEKIQTKVSLTDAETLEWGRARQRILLLCQKANKTGVKIFFDAEESWIQNVIDDSCYEMMALFNKDRAIVYNTYQMYRHDMLDNYRAACQVAIDEGYCLGAKLVRGAYMEKEAARARSLGYVNPIHRSKEAVDHDYNEAIGFSLAHIEKLSICLGTHNEHSCALCISEMKRNGIDKNDERIYFAQLLGMSDNISFNLALAGYNVAKYVPFGPIDAVMPYLIRRANENTAIAGQSSREFSLISKELLRRKS